MIICSVVNCIISWFKFLPRLYVCKSKSIFSAKKDVVMKYSSIRFAAISSANTEYNFSHTTYINLCRKY